jgi:hypothetical protein
MLSSLRVVTFFLTATASLVFAKDYETLGKNVVQDLLARRFEKVASQVNESWAKIMPPSEMAKFLNAVFLNSGAFQTFAGTRSEEEQGYHVVFVTCRFEKNIVEFTVSFDPKDRVAVITASPAKPSFDEKADARIAIKMAVDAAAADDIRVLIAWVSNDDKGSTLFLDSRRAPAVATPAFFSNEYRTVNVNVGHIDRNVELAKSYGAMLKADALPALTVLDSAGTVIANTNAGTLRPDANPSGIDPEKLAAFLESHQAPPPDAVAQFEASLKRAHKEGKTVFVWFSAPW